MKLLQGWYRLNVVVGWSNREIMLKVDKQRIYNVLNGNNA